MQPKPIYHLIPVGYYLAQPANQPYTPPAFADEGFVHCTAGADLLVEIANTYFTDLAEPLLALRIDPQQLTSPLRFEAPIPPGQSALKDGVHSAPDVLFPHIYGPINREAIAECITLQRNYLGCWQLPAK